MWLFEKRRDVLRVGKLVVELWVREAGGLVKRRSVALGGLGDVRAAVQEVLAGEVASRAAVDVVVESAHLPVVLLEPGPNLLRREQVEVLLRHRLARVYDARTDAVANWALEVEHRAGDAYGLGFGLSPLVKAAIETGALASGRRLASVQPVMQWARQMAQPRDGWWIWLEQDRAVVAWLERGRVTALNAAADAPRDAAEVGRLVRIECARSGVGTADAPVHLSGWERPFVMGEGGALSWHGVAGASELAAVAPARAAGAAA